MGVLSTEGHVGKRGVCKGTQSDPTTLCSQTASAIYLGSTSQMQVVMASWPGPSHSGGHTAWAWPCKEPAPVSSRLQCPF